MGRWSRRSHVILDLPACFMRTSIKPDHALEPLIDADETRRALTDLTAHTGGDGSDRKIRMEALALLKQRYQHGRSEAERLLIEDGSGSNCARRLSDLQDELVRCIHDFAIVHVFRAANLSEGERMSIAAVGGYGRGTLAPGSDIDLLFLLPYKQTALGESLVEFILYMLWDMGFKVGHATRTIDECIRLSREDMTIRTSVLEARFLWGDKALFETMWARFDDEIVRTTAKEFIEAKLAERDARHEKSGQSRYLVEPNVKDGKGGLRDLHTLFWISKYFYRVRSRDELLERKVFSPAEFSKFNKAHDFLWAVRCHLHFLTRRSEERLSFDVQAQLAERLGYLPHPGQSAGERFMKHYFLIAKDVGDLTRILCAALEEEHAKSVSGISGVIRSMTSRPRKIRGTDQFVNVNNRIKPIDDKVFARDPVNIIKIFRIAEEKGHLFHPDAMRSLSQSLKLIDKSLRLNPLANADFLACLTSSKTPERTLRKMNECGVLGRFIPAFGKIVAMMQFNMYHHYTVDEHLLRSIGVLAEIEHREVSEEHPLADELMQNPPDRVVLYVALLLHDVAKGRPEDHSIAGARVARRICPRLGLSNSQTEMVAWLIEHHLLMSNTAQSRDLNDLRTISDFADVMQSMERMRALLVLTVCDIKAVGPGVWNGWKGQLLRTLYYEAEPHLTGGFTSIPRRERIAEVRDNLHQALKGWNDTDRERYINLLYDNYLLTVPFENQVRHLNFLKESDEAGLRLATTIEMRKFEAVTEITLLAPDHPRLLSTITGCCAAAGANIVDAQVFTTGDGRALDTIFINRAYKSDEDELRRAERISETIEQVLSGEIRLKNLLQSKQLREPRRKAFRLKPVVRISNDISDKFTVIEIEALDRKGVLSMITDALADLSLDIASAQIATFGEKFIDTFYVTDLVGFKITSPQKISAIRRKLLGKLSPDTEAEQAKATAS